MSRITKGTERTMSERRRHLIEYAVAKPFVDAVALGAGSAAFATVLQGPALNWSLIGGGFSLFWYWGTANLTKPKKAKAKGGSIGPGSIVVNTFNGSRTVRRDGKNFNYQPGYISREIFPEILRRLVRGKPRIRQAPLGTPIALREFVFHSHYRGQPIELSENDVRRFLRSAWRNRQRGSGLSQRRWDRDRRLRPQWYKDLGPHWYYALLALLREAQQITRRQLVVCTGPQWYALACDSHTTLFRLREAEAVKRGSPAPVDEFSANFERGESSF